MESRPDDRQIPKPGEPTEHDDCFWPTAICVIVLWLLALASCAHADSVGDRATSLVQGAGEGGGGESARAVDRLPHFPYRSRRAIPDDIADAWPHLSKDRSLRTGRLRVAGTPVALFVCGAQRVFCISGIPPHDEKIWPARSRPEPAAAPSSTLNITFQNRSPRQAHGPEPVSTRNEAHASPLRSWVRIPADPPCEWVGTRASRQRPASRIDQPCHLSSFRQMQCGIGWTATREWGARASRDLGRHSWGRCPGRGTFLEVLR